MEQLRITLSPDSQGQIIERYCAEARELLKNANSREQALAIRARICSQLARECDSSLILDATQTYVDRVIRDMWKKSGKGDNA